MNNSRVKFVFENQSKIQKIMESGRGEWFEYLIDIMHTHRSRVCLIYSVYAARACRKSKFILIMSK